MVKVEIVAVGNELLMGDVLDTNTNWLCRKITGLGGRVVRAVMVRDELGSIAKEVKSALERSTQVIFTTGGMGPTDDDMTLTAVAEATGLPLLLNRKALDMVEEKYRLLVEMGYIEDNPMNPGREKTARLPDGARPILNPVGAAPGVLLHVGPSKIVSLPGVPSEMKGIFEGPLQPILKGIFGQGAYYQLQTKVKYNDESILAPILKKVVEGNPETYVKSHVGAFGPEVEIKVTLSAAGTDMAEAKGRVEAALSDLKSLLWARNIEIEVEG
jgi:molybdenum cofactor synthesis domain-containing protein